ncbi:hypothetical protein Tco_0790116 [Tanacetum coccineum]
MLSIQNSEERLLRNNTRYDAQSFYDAMIFTVPEVHNSKFTLDYDSQMTDTYFVEYTGLEVQHFRDTLLQHLGNVKKSVAERTRHQRQYERRVNKRQMQTQESKIDTGKALDADLVDTESIRTGSTVQVITVGQQHTEQPEIIVEGWACTQIQTTTDDSKPNPRSNNQTSRSLPVSTSSRVTIIMAVPKQITLRVLVLFQIPNFAHPIDHNRNKLVDQKSHTQKPGRQIFIGHRFSPNTTSAVYEKTSPRSDLRYPNIHACKQSDVSADDDTGKMTFVTTVSSLELNVIRSRVNKNGSSLGLNVNRSHQEAKQKQHLMSWICYSVLCFNVYFHWEKIKLFKVLAVPTMMIK